VSGRTQGEANETNPAMKAPANPASTAAPLENKFEFVYINTMNHLANAIAAGFVMLAGATSALAESLELVMFERAGCIYCVRWDREVGPAYPLTPQGQMAPLRKVNLDKGQPPFKLDVPVRYSPTFVLMKDGREVGRITGYMNDAMFWGVFAKMIERLKPSPARGDQL